MTIDEAYLTAFMISQASKDESTKVGCLIASRNWDFTPLGMGFNAFPDGVDTSIAARHLRPDKYDWTVHAELNALAACAQIGARTAAAYCFSTQIPCPTCMGALLQSKILTIVCPDPSNLAPKWLSSSAVSIQMAKEVGINLFFRTQPAKELYETISLVP